MLSLFIIPTPLESNDWINNFLITRSVSKISCNRLGPLAYCLEPFFSGTTPS